MNLEQNELEQLLNKAINQALAPILEEVRLLRAEVANYRASMSDTTPMFTIGQVCAAANCSRSTFYKYWQLYHLPMPEPKTSANIRPRYSQADICRLQEALKR